MPRTTVGLCASRALSVLLLLLPMAATAEATITIQVSTLADENDCPSCTVAQLQAFRTLNNVAGGGTGISLREAITAINNDFHVNGTINQGVGFTTLASAASTVNPLPDLQTSCAAMAGGTVWLMTLVQGALPVIEAPGTTIDGTTIRSASFGGPTATLGPKVIVSGSGLVIAASASGVAVKGLALIGSAADAVIVGARNAQILLNWIGLGCDAPSPPTPDGPAFWNAGSGIRVEAGTSNLTISKNFISGNA